MPTLTKTWNHHRATVAATGSITNDVVAWRVAVKDIYKLMGWVVKGSSTGSVGGMDGVDRWTNGVALGNRAWIVLRNEIMNAEILFRTAEPGNPATNMGFWVAREPFTHSSTPEVRPVAVGEFFHSVGYVHPLESDASYTYYILGMTTSSFKSSRIITVSSKANRVVHSHLWEELKTQSTPDPEVPDPGIDWTSAIYSPGSGGLAGVNDSFYDFLLEDITGDPQWIDLGDWTVPWNGTSVPWVTPVGVQIARSVDARRLELVFNQAVNSEDALNPANYSISPSLGVLGVTRITDLNYMLTTAQQANGQSYTVAVSNIRNI